MNEKTVDQKFPTPQISDTRDKLGISQYFTILDLANGFHQVEIDPVDISKTTLPQKWASFQKVMNNVLVAFRTKFASYKLIFPVSSIYAHEKLQIIFGFIEQFIFF